MKTGLWARTSTASNPKHEKGPTNHHHHKIKIPEISEIRHQNRKAKAPPWGKGKHTLPSITAGRYVFPHGTTPAEASIDFDSKQNKAFESSSCAQKPL